MKTYSENNRCSMSDMLVDIAWLIKNNPDQSQLWSNLRNIFSEGQQLDLSLLIEYRIMPAEASQWNKLQLEAYCDILALKINPDLASVWATLGDAFAAGVEFDSLNIKGKKTFFSREVRNGDIRRWKQTDFVAYCDAQALRIAPGSAYIWVNLANDFKHSANYSRLATSSQASLFPIEARIWDTKKFPGYCYQKAKNICLDFDALQTKTFLHDEKRKITVNKPADLHPLLIQRLEKKSQNNVPAHSNQSIFMNRTDTTSPVRKNNIPLGQLYRPIRPAQFNDLQKFELLLSSDSDSALNVAVNDSATMPLSVQQRQQKAFSDYVQPRSDHPFVVTPSVVASQPFQTMKQPIIFWQNKSSEYSMHVPNTQPFIRKRSLPPQEYPGTENPEIQASPLRKKQKLTPETDTIASHSQTTHSTPLNSQIDYHEIWDRLNLPYLDAHETSENIYGIPENGYNRKPGLNKFFYTDRTPVPIHEEVNIISTKEGNKICHHLNNSRVITRKHCLNLIRKEKNDRAPEYVYADDGTSVSPDETPNFTSKIIRGKYRYIYNERVVTTYELYKNSQYSKKNKDKHKGELVLDGIPLSKEDYGKLTIVSKASSTLYFLDGKKVVTRENQQKINYLAKRKLRENEFITRSDNFETTYTNFSENPLFENDLLQGDRLEENTPVRSQRYLDISSEDIFSFFASSQENETSENLDYYDSIPGL